MPHVHDKPGQIDFVAEIFIVHQQKVLLRLHDKRGWWLPPGGHVELDETPEEAAVREVEEETGLKVEIFRNGTPRVFDETGERELTVPVFMNVHSIDENHRHISCVYFAYSDTDEVIQPETHEKTACKWFTEDEVIALENTKVSVKEYALEALRRLSK